MKKKTNKKKGYKFSPALENGNGWDGLPLPPFNPNKISKRITITKKDLTEDKKK